MGTEKKTVTRTKKVKEDTKLAKDKQERVKILSKIVHIFAKILKVFTIIGVVCLLFAIVFTPVIVKNIRIDKENIMVFNNKIEYKYSENKVDLLYNNVTFASMSDDEKVKFDVIIAELAKTDITKSFAFIELALIASAAGLFILYFILSYVDMLFANFSTNETPFTDENADYINKIAYLSLVSFIIAFVSDVVSSLLFKNSLVRLSLTSLAVIVVLYVISYVFEYACILQKNSKSKLYEA